MATEIFFSGVLKAANEGKIVIIDEFNYIPPALLAGLNALIEAPAGQKINVFGQEIEVKNGFGVILTGNLTRSEFIGRYQDRQRLDPALVNRLNSGLIEYTSLPQDTNVSFAESILSIEQKNEGREIPKRELFQIGLTLVADEKGNIRGPQDLLEQIWNLSREFSLLQKIYGGEELDSPVKLVNTGQDVILKEYPISNRTFRSIIEAWRNENYCYSLDWYIYDNLIRPASLVSSSEAGQLFILLKERGGFFNSPEWSVLNIEENTWKILGIEKIEKNRKAFLKNQKMDNQKYYFTPAEVAKAFLGVEMPSILKIMDSQLMLHEQEEFIQYVREYQRLVEKVRKLEDTIDRFGKDQQEILGRYSSRKGGKYGDRDYEMFKDQINSFSRKLEELGSALDEYKETGDRNLLSGIKRTFPETSNRIQEGLDRLREDMIIKVKDLLNQWYPKKPDRDVFLNSIRFDEDGRVEVEELDVSECQLIELYIPNVIKSIKKLNCAHNRLTFLPDLPEGLEVLDCHFNQLNSLSNLPESLKKLYCYINRLTFLPDLPEGLEVFCCYSNQLNSLSHLPESLKELNCCDNQLTFLPDLPKGLEVLDCHSNQLNSLSNLPESLKILDCSRNALTFLPDLPEGLEELDCRSNHLRSLPDLPISLRVLDCRGNPLTAEAKRKILNHPNYSYRFIF